MDVTGTLADRIKMISLTKLMICAPCSSFSALDEAADLFFHNLSSNSDVSA